MLQLCAVEGKSAVVRQPNRISLRRLEDRAAECCLRGDREQPLLDNQYAR
jgi:hypothetical protein